MTKKDYELIATEIAFHASIGENSHFSALIIANSLSHRFEEQNSKFNRDKFMQACGFKASYVNDKGVTVYA